LTVCWKVEGKLKREREKQLGKRSFDSFSSRRHTSFEVGIVPVVAFSLGRILKKNCFISKIPQGN
jgi:hypothetical protein